MRPFLETRYIKTWVCVNDKCKVKVNGDTAEACGYVCPK